MSHSRIDGFRVAGISTCVPANIEDNHELGRDFGEDEVRKVVGMAGIRYRRVAPPGVTATDLCCAAAERLLERLGWERDSISALILVTQSPDYFLPSSSCIAQQRLGLGDECAAFDVGLGCSGFPYGLYLAASMLKSGGHRRILLLHGETPSRFASPDDHTTRLLFGDAGSAIAVELAPDAPPGYFCLRSDGSGADGLIIRGGAFRDRDPADARDRYVRMDGAAIFSFTLARVPPLVRDTLQFAGLQVNDVDWYLFHQSNRFMMKHLAKKCGLPDERVPLVLEQYGNSGGPSVALALTEGVPPAARGPARVMAVGYGVGLSWGAAVFDLAADTVLLHGEHAASEPA